MNIQDALKETGKATREGGTDSYAALKMFSLSSPKTLGGERLYWYTIETGEENSPVQLDAILEDDWQPYHDKKEIRPEKAGELWRHNETEGYFHTDHSTQDASLILIGYKGVSRNAEIVHGTHWNRLFPPVEDDNIKRIQIEDITWERLEKNTESYIIPFKCRFNDAFKFLVGKPPMKMILEISKD